MRRKKKQQLLKYRWLRMRNDTVMDMIAAFGEEEWHLRICGIGKGVPKHA